MKGSEPTTTLARFWPNDFAPWEVEMPVCPRAGVPSKLTIAVKQGWGVYELTLTRKDRSDGAWNFYETSRKRLAPGY